jgi:hypothetical protein
MSIWRAVFIGSVVAVTLTILIYGIVPLMTGR